MDWIRVQWYMCLSAVVLWIVSPGLSRADDLFYETDIQSILVAKCAKCHGDEMQKAELNVVGASELQQGGESGPVIVPGNPAESLLLEMITEGEMPPEDSEPLTTEEVGRIRR